MKKLVVATIACGLLFSAMTMVGQQTNTKTNGKAMQDAKQAKQYGGAKFDGSKVKTNTAVPVSGQKAQPNYKALNQAEHQRQAAASKQLHLDKPTKPIPSPAPQKKQ